VSALPDRRRDRRVLRRIRLVERRKDAIDVDEIITALAKTVAEMTFGCDAPLRQRILEDLMREISQFEAEFANAPTSDVRH